MKNKKKKKNRFAEFSKFILILFAVFYFIGGAFIIWVVHYQLKHALSPEYISAEAVVTYFTAPITAGLVMYFGKAGVENFQKIKGSNQQQENTEKNKIAKG